MISPEEHLVRMHCWLDGGLLALGRTLANTFLSTLSQKGGKMFFWVIFGVGFWHDFTGSHVSASLLCCCRSWLFPAQAASSSSKNPRIVVPQQAQRST